MQYSSVLYTSHTPISDVHFFDPTTKLGDNVFFINETLNDIFLFLKNQNKSLFHTITVPGIIPNFLGKKLSSQKHFAEIKKQYPAFKYNRIPDSKTLEVKASLFDMSAITPDIISLSKSRSKKIVIETLFTLLDSIIKDYPKETKKCLLIYGDNISTTVSETNTDFIQLLEYYFKLQGNRLHLEFESIVYFMNNKYYPLTTKELDKENRTVLKFNNAMYRLIMTNKTKNITKGTELTIEDIHAQAGNNITRLEALRTEIKKLSSILDDAEDDVKKDTIGKIKSLIDKEPELVGSFEDKLKMLFNDKSLDHEKHISNVLELHDDVNNKYNGLIDITIPHLGVFDTQEIVGLKTLSSYNKQYKELMENIDEDIEALIESTLKSEPDVDITIHSITQKIVDDNKNRYKEFTVKISHKDYGNTTDKPYPLKFRTPVVVNDKYVKLGGNNYIMISQMFPQPIVKVQPNLIRLFTNFSISHVELKNTKLNAKMNFKDVEQTLVNNLKALGKVKKDESFSNASKNDIGNKYGIPDLESFGYKKLEITI